MMIEDRFFDQEWVQELSNEKFRMLMYLFHFASKKTGLLELNMRQINFAANTGRQFTQEDVLREFGNMLTLVPGKSHTAIFPDYIATNWMKNGKPIDVNRNPLFKSIVNELATVGLTIDKVNEIAKRKVEVCNSEQIQETQDQKEVDDGADINAMFEEFWKAYPSECPRKVDKKKCRIKFTQYMKPCLTRNILFGQILEGLERWKNSDTWKKNGGQYIRAPLVWLNGRNWEDEPMKERKGINETARRIGSANANYKGDGTEANNIF